MNYFGDIIFAFFFEIDEAMQNGSTIYKIIHSFDIPFKDKSPTSEFHQVGDCKNVTLSMKYLSNHS